MEMEWLKTDNDGMAGAIDQRMQHAMKNMFPSSERAHQGWFIASTSPRRREMTMSR